MINFYELKKELEQIKAEQTRILKKYNIVVRTANDLNKLPQTEIQNYTELALREHEIKALIGKI